MKTSFSFASLLAFLVLVGATHAAPPPPPEAKKGIVCHGTSADNNPYQMLNISVNAIPTHFTDKHNQGKKYHDALPGDTVEVLGKNYTLGQNCSLIPEPLTPSTGGDPHFKTWNGHKFDFHGGCDLVLLQNPGFASELGLDIHIRTKISTSWSYIESAVLRIGPDTLELSGKNYWINGEPGEELEDGDMVKVSGYPAKYRKISPHQSRFRIDLGDGDAIALETFKSWVRVNIHATKSESFDGSVGMMGSYPSGAMMARNGSTLLEDADSFGKEWQVLAGEPILFHQAPEVSHPVECAMPDTAAKPKRRLGESLVTEEGAAIACGHAKEEEHDACIFDVLATNDKEMAGAY